MVNDTPLLSNIWYRVAELRPQMLTHVRLHRHRYRGEVWYLLQDPASGRVHRFTPAARLLIAAMDGRRSVNDIWKLAGRRLGEEGPTQDEVIQLLSQLHASDLLRTDVPPDALELFERGERTAAQKRRRIWANPMAMRVPLVDPGRFLDRYVSVWQWLWGRAGAVAWLLVVAPALALLPAHWVDLTNNISDQVLSAGNLLALSLVFPLVKALHELGHATATRAGGGEVHDMGVMLLVLMPVPYVDASSASVLRSRWDRARVGAAGMLVELFIAAVAFYLWIALEPGFARALCFNVMVIAGVSTIVFNGNPLLRYDAYYILSDLAELPNLSQQSTRYWSYLLERYLLRVDDAVSPAQTPSERAWFGLYGVASTAYRVFVTIAIALFIATQFFFIGVLLAVWAVVMMMGVPVYKAFRHLNARPTLRRRRLPLATYGGALVAFLAALALVVPVPNRTQAEGVVWLPDRAILRAGADGWLQGFEVAPGSTVSRGDVLAHSLDPALVANLRHQEARVAELEANYDAAYVTDQARADMVRKELALERNSLERARERLRLLTLVAPSDGVFTVSTADDLPGRFFHKGDVIGHVLGEVHPVVRVVVEQAVVESLGASVPGVWLRLAGATDVTYRGQIVRQVPAGSDEVPSPTLNTSGGGRIAADPRDPEGRRTFERVFQLDVAPVPELPADAGFGRRVFVRFDMEPKPIAVQWYGSLRRLFLNTFSV